MHSLVGQQAACAVAAASPLPHTRSPVCSAAHLTIALALSQPQVPFRWDVAQSMLSMLGIIGGMLTFISPCLAFVADVATVKTSLDNVTEAVNKQGEAHTAALKAQGEAHTAALEVQGERLNMMTAAIIIGAALIVRSGGQGGGRG